MKDRSIRIAFKNSIPVMVGYIVLGIAFGVLLAEKGYSFIWAFVISATIYAGSMQFVAVNLLAGGATLVATAIMTLIVNARHLFYGISMLEKYRGTGKAKPYLIFALTDETYALVCGGNPENTDKRKYFFFLSLFNQCYWITGSVIGALLSTAIEFNSAGIDFAMTALFVVIFVEQLTSGANRIPAFIGAITSAVCLILFGSQNFLIPAMIAITVILCVYGEFFAKDRADG